MVRIAELWKSYRANPRVTLQDITEALQRTRRNEPGGLKPEEFSIRDLAGQFITDEHGEPIGMRAVEALCRSQRLLETDAALNTTAFAAITRQVINAAVLEGYELPDFVLSQAVPTINGQNREARIVGVSLPLAENKSVEVHEGQEYPVLGMYDEYAKTPGTVKRGAIVAVTKEAVLADETGLIVQQAREVGQFIALQKEIALVDYAIGAVANCVVEKRVGDSAEVTKNLFYDAAAGERWTNEQVNALADWTDIDAAENLLIDNTLPGTGQPPILTQRFVLVPSQLRSTASRILNATETRSGTGNVVVAANPVAGMGLRLATSPLVYSRLVAAGVAAADAAATWFYGDLARAVKYYQNWGLTTEEDRTREATFTHDILVRFKASERGTPVVCEARVWSKNTPV